MPTLLLSLLLAPPAVPTDSGRAEPPPPTAASLLEGALPLNPAGTVRLDRERNRVLVRAEVVLRRGPLEMLLCLPQTKEHESILSYEGDARTLHAGLVAAGLEPGEPVSFDPEFAPPRGPVLDLTLYWTDAGGAPRTAPAHDWVRTSTDGWYERDLAALPAGLELPEDLELRHDAGNGDLLWYGRMTGEDRDRALALSADEQFRKLIREFYRESQPRPLTADFVFAGSYVWDKPVAYDAEGNVTETERSYAAEGGEVVCVANFPAATIDIAERSSADGENVLYEAATELIPPKGTDVLITFAAAKAPPAAPAPVRDEPVRNDSAPDEDVPADRTVPAPTGSRQ